MDIAIRGKARGSAEEAYQKAKARGATRLDFLRDYFNALYAAAATLGIDPDVLVAQWDLETGSGTSTYWTRDGNPAGIGAFPDGSSIGAKFSPGSAARIQVTHMGGYLGLTDIPESWIAMNPRWQDMIDAGFFGSVNTVADLGNGRWATDPKYAEKIMERYVAYWGDPREEPVMAVRFEKRIATSRLGEFSNLRDLNAWFTIHENGNPNSGPRQEAAFVANGGGSEKVAYHFAVGVEGGVATIVQIMPVNKRGRHAGNAEGNATSAAVEVSQAPPGPLSDLTQEALRELMYMLYTGDPRIEGLGNYKFSPDRTQGHGDWSGANPNCPQFIKSRWGGVGPIITRVRERLNSGGGDESQYDTADPIPEVATKAPFIKLGNGAQLFRAELTVTALRNTPRRKWADPNSPKIGPDVQAGQSFEVAYLIVNANGTLYWYTPWNTRITFEDAAPYVA